jgi:UDP-2,4-diacetamido-2,4,6-trideoxy-beta-L-altropyranose hydrolase
MKIVIRTDASQQIGAGHAMRCLTLAEVFRDSGATTEFITRAHVGNLNNYIKSKGFMVYPLLDPSKFISQDNLDGYEEWLGVKQQKDAEETIQLLVGTHADLLIIDHYALDYMWENMLRPHTDKIMVIDDLAARTHDCDWLLDMTEGRQMDDYRHKVPCNCQFLLGARYALLRPQFAKYRVASLEKREKQRPVKRILVSMGGSDPVDATSWVLRGIEQANVDAKIDVVIGVQAQHIKHIQAQISKMKSQVRLLSQVENMAELMIQADLAIGAGGTTSWERCCLGLPTIILVTEDNQRMIAKNLHHLGAVWSMGWFSDIQSEDFVEQLQKMIVDNDGRYNMSCRASNVCDGGGARITCKALF